MAEIWQLLPERDGGAAGLSEWAVREQAGKLVRRSISHPQFKKYRERGLLGEPSADSRWPPNVVGRVVRVHELGKTARSLDRRVILLQRESLDFTIPPQELRKAMVAILPSITAPQRKMHRLDKASVLWARFNEAQATAEGLYGRTYMPAGWRIPEPATWDALLTMGSLAFFKEQAGWKFYTEAIIRTVVQHIDPTLVQQLEQIPLEERVTLLMIREMALWVAQGFHGPEETAAR